MALRLLQPTTPYELQLAEEADSAERLAKVGIGLSIAGLLWTGLKQQPAPTTIIQQSTGGSGSLTPSATVTEVTDVTGAVGVSNEYSRGDHAHGHGIRAAVTGLGVGLHAAATGTTPGFMPAASWLLLNGPQTARTFLSGPVGGGALAPTYRTIGFADLPPNINLQFSGAGNAMAGTTIATPGTVIGDYVWGVTAYVTATGAAVMPPLVPGVDFAGTVGAANTITQQTAGLDNYTMIFLVQRAT